MLEIVTMGHLNFGPNIPEDWEEQFQELPRKSIAWKDPSHNLGKRKKGNWKEGERKEEEEGE